MSEAVAERFGIWITIAHWATVDGGNDLVGARAAMIDKAHEWAAQSSAQAGWVHYRVTRYDGEVPMAGRDLLGHAICEQRVSRWKALAKLLRLDEIRTIEDRAGARRRVALSRAASTEAGLRARIAQLEDAHAAAVEELRRAGIETSFTDAEERGHE